MKQVATFFLKSAVVLMGAGVLFLCVRVLPVALREGGADFAPIFLTMYASAVPFFLALYHIFRLLVFVDRRQAFSAACVKALGTIKWCAGIITLLYAAVSPVAYLRAQDMDAPGVLALWLLVGFVSFVVGAGAMLLESLIGNAVELKSENDLTV